VANFLNEAPPFAFGDPEARDLWALLSATYQNKSAVGDLLAQIDVDSAEINWDQPMRWVWADILTLSHRQAKLRGLLGLITASADGAVSTRICEIIGTSPVRAAPTTPPATTWKGFGDPTAERIIQSQPTLLDIAFLRRGVELSAGVCRLLVTLSGHKYYGTAFRIANDLLLTNHHVLLDRSKRPVPATEVEAWFGYERTFEGSQLPYTVVPCDPETITGDRRDDWAVVHTKDTMPDDVPIIEIRGATPVAVDDRVYIIQHPRGGPKKIGMIHNVVRHVDDHVIQYLTDTEGGSSGAPVFNEQWELVALHHQWVSFDAGDATEFRNQGRRIERVLEGMQAAQVF
jgi:endonuclease G